MELVYSDRLERQEAGSLPDKELAVRARGGDLRKSVAREYRQRHDRASSTPNARQATIPTASPARTSRPRKGKPGR